MGFAWRGAWFKSLNGQQPLTSVMVLFYRTALKCRQMYSIECKVSAGVGSICSFNLHEADNGLSLDT